MSKKEIEPAVAGVLDTKTGKYYFGINNVKGKELSELHTLIKERIDNILPEIYSSYEKWILRAGSHAEVYALNEETGEEEYKEVKKVFVRSGNEIYITKYGNNIIK